MTTILQLSSERTALTTRLLELEVQETEWSRAYYCNNVPTSMKDRSTLLAERARIKLRIHQINLQVNGLRTAGMGVEVQS